MQTLASSFYRQGLIKKWFFEWKNVKLQIIGKLNTNERNQLITLEEGIIKEQNKNKRVILIEGYVEKLQELIEAKKIGLIDAEDKKIFS